MRCKKHPADLSSGVGVCATCLRERLFAIMAAQAQSQQTQKELITPPPPPPPQPLSFPRSVSPYISRRKSDTAVAWPAQSRHHRFFSTPQVGPDGSTAVEIEKGGRGRRSRGGRFLSLFLGFFRSKPERPDSGPGPSPDPGVSADSCTASAPSWFYPTFIAGRRKIKERTPSVDETKNGSRQRRICRKNRDRGMSPARCPEDEDEGGYSSESSPVWRPTPRSTPSQGRRGVGKAATPGKNVSGMIFCLSPLVRASPNRQRNQKGMAPEIGAAGESRPPARPCISAAASFCKSRSRKLADFGRYN